MTYAKKRKKGGEMVACDPSRFLDELPEDDLNWEGSRGPELSEEEKQQRGKAHLANLKGLLGDSLAPVSSESAADHDIEPTSVVEPPLAEEPAPVTEASQETQAAPVIDEPRPAVPTIEDEAVQKDDMVMETETMLDTIPVFIKEEMS
jgi:hypothetical protein